MSYRPPFDITDSILLLCQEISKELGMLRGVKLLNPSVQLRKKNKIKTIQSSLAIEGNSFSEQHIQDFIDGKKVIAPKQDIVEVKNALQVYKDISVLNPLSIKSMLKAHKILMQELTTENGVWRSKGVGVITYGNATHLAPKAMRVPTLMQNLFSFLKTNRELSWLVKACVFHYELEFIHPFSDGNGRMGRLWQQLLLMKENEIFKYMAIESLIKKYQHDYYHALSSCDKKGSTTLFIEFMLNMVLNTLKEFTNSSISPPENKETRIAYAKKHLKKIFSRKDYMLLHKNLSSATASRDLYWALKNDLLQSRGKMNQKEYFFKQ